MSLDELNVDALPRNVDLSFEIHDEATLTMTAQQLHEKVIDEGVSLADDDNEDVVNGSVVITGGGEEFDPFNSTDVIKSNINGNEYNGGSLSSDFDSFNVSVQSVYKGYDRPADVEAEVVLTIDADALNGDAVEAFNTWHTNLEIVGNADVMVDGVIDLGVNDGTGAAALNDFTVDFSTLNGQLSGLTLGNFDNAAAIMGNSNADVAVDEVRIDVELGGNVGTAQQGLVSSGVQTYVVVDLDDADRDFYTCETTQDLEVLGLQGNYGNEINFLNTERGVDFLMEVVYDKSEGYVVGELHGEFARDGADAVVNVVGLQDLPAGETQMVEGITLTNADTATINVEGGNTEVEAFAAAGLESLTLAADADLEMTGALPTSLTSVDASGVAGSLDIELGAPAAGAEDIAFTGAAGATTLTLSGAVDSDDFASIEGAGGVALVIDAAVDLTETTLTNITSVTLENGAALTLTMEQADVIGAANFVIADGDAATLTLEGLNDQEFSIANYDDNITVAVTLADEETVTLHDDTDLTGIASLNIPEGTTLVLTAAQFQQLDGAGVLTGDGSVHITGLTQADAGENGEDLDLTSIAVNGSVTVTLAESVDLTEATLGTVVDTINIGDNQTLTLDQIDAADGVEINGGAESTLTFTDTVAGAADFIDASGFNMTYVKLLNVLVDGVNVDEVLGGLPGSVTKVIYKGYGQASTIDQTFTVEAGVIISGAAVAFDASDVDVEIANFTLNMEGGSELSGLDLSTSVKFDDISEDGIQDVGEENLQRGLLQSLTINSTGTEVNPITDTTVNIITGDITATNGVDAGGNNNNLLTVNINGEQALDVQGDIVFSSVVGDDDFTNNDDDEATATLNIDTTAAIDLAGLNTTDADVTGLVINHTGTGSLEFTLDGNHDVENFTVNGSAEAETVLVVEDSAVVDLTDATLVNLDQITLEDNAAVTLIIDQLDTLGIDNIVHNEYDDAADEGLVNIGEYDGREFDFNMPLQDGINVGIVTFVAGSEENPETIEVNSATDFTGIAALNVPEFTTVTLSADQFKQLVESGALVTGAGSIVVDVDADLTIGAADETTINGADVSFDLADGVTLNVDTLSLADGLQVSGDAAALVKALVNFTFQDDNTDDNPDNFTDTINVSSYNNVDVRILDDLLDNFQTGGGNSQSIEDLLVGLENANILNIYREDPADDPDLDPRDRVVVVEPDADPEGIEFSKGSVDYVRAVDLTLQTGTDGDALIDGDITVNDALVIDGFTTLTINTEVADGETAAADAVVTINGGIKSDGADAGDAGELRDIDINAAVDLVVTGVIDFNSETAADYVATLDVVTSDGASVTLEELDADTTEEIAVSHTGDGELNLTLDAGDAATTLISFSGDGINLTIDPDATILDLSADDLTAIDSITLENGAALTLSLAQVLALTEANLTGDDVNVGTNTLNINGFDASAFDITDYTEIDLGVVTIDGDITLDAATNLTGATIAVPEGSSLTLTAAQYVQLSTAGGNISGLGNVTITDLTAAENAIDLSTVTATGTLTLTLGEDVDLDENADLGNFAVELTDGQTINFFSAEQANGQTVTGTATSIVEFGFDYASVDADTDGVVDAGDQSVDFGAGAGAVIGLDLSNIDVGELHVLNALVEDQNVEQILGMLDEDVEVVVYAPEDPGAPALGDAFSTDRVVTVEADTEVDGTLDFADLQDDTYVRTLTLNLEGNASVTGLIDINILQALDAGLNDAYFETLTINSTGSAANTLANISAGTDGAGDENNLLDVDIDASAALNIGTITFTSVNADADDATATVDVAGDAVVTIAGLNTADTDVDALTVTSTSTAELALTLQAASVPATLTIDGGTAGAALTIDGGESVNLSAATLTNINDITLESGSTLTLDADQLVDIGVTNLAIDDPANSASLVINDFAGQAVDFSTLDLQINNVTLNIEATGAVVTLDPTTNLTNVDSIVVPVGTTLELTADQFEQLGGVADAISGDGTVNITDLDSDNEDINLSTIADTITAGSITLDATATTVTLTTDAVLDVDVGLTKKFSIIFGAEGQTLELAEESHADGRTIDGSAFTSAIVKLDFAAPETDGIIGSGNFDISDIHVWDDYVESFNGFELEDVLHNLPQDVTVTIFDVAAVVTPGTPDVAIDTIVRNIVVQEDTDVAEDIIIDDENDDREIAYVNLTLEGNASIQDLNLRTTNNTDAGEFDLLLQELNIVSSGDNANTIGDIYADPADSYSAITQTMDRAVQAGDTLSVTINGNLYSQLFDTSALNTYNLLAAAIEAGETIDVTVDNTDVNNPAFTFDADDESNFVLTADLANDDGSTAGAVIVTDSAQVTLENNLLDINIDASQALTIGAIEFSYLTNSLEDAGDNTGTPYATRPAELTIEGTGNVTITSLDAATDAHVEGLTITNDGTGTLTVLGASPAVSANGVITLVGGDMVFGTGDVDVDGTADSAGFDLSGTNATGIDASGVTGSLALGTLINVGVDFTLTSGTGVTTVSLAGTDDTAVYTVAADSVVTIDLSNAAAGSSVTLDESVTFASGTTTTVTIDTGAGDLNITGDVDLTTVDVLDVTNVADVVLADDATISMTDAQFATFTGTISGDTDLVLDAGRLGDFAGQDLTDVRGLTSIDLDDAIDLVTTPIILTVAQFAVTTVTDSGVDPAVTRNLAATEYTISDTWANIQNITDSTLTDAASYEITDLASLTTEDLTGISAEQAGILLNADDSNSGALTATITVDDTWANWQQLVTDAEAGDDNAVAALAGALNDDYDHEVSDITVNQSDLSIAEAALLTRADNYDALVNFYSIATTAAAVDGAGAPVDYVLQDSTPATVHTIVANDVTTLLTGATSVSITGLSFAQYDDGAGAGFSTIAGMNLTSFSIEDVWANTFDGNNGGINDAARDNAVSYSLTDIDTADFTTSDLLMVDALILRGASNFATQSPAVAYDISDAVAEFFPVGSNFGTGVESAINGATAVTVTGDVTAAQGQELETTTATTLTYAVVDGFAALNTVVQAAGTPADAFASASSVSANTAAALDSELEALTAQQITDLATAGLDAIDMDATEQTANLTVAQFLAFDAAGFTVAATDTINVIDSVAALDATTADVGDLSNVGVTGTGGGSVTVQLAAGGADQDITAITLDTDVDTIDVNNQAAVMTIAQASSLSVTLSGGTAQVQLQAAGDLDLTDDTLDANVTLLDLNAQNLTFNQAQYAALTLSDDGDGAGGAGDSDVTNNTITLTGGVDTQAEIAAAGADANIDTVEVDDDQGAITLTVAELNAITATVTADADGVGTDSTIDVTLANADSVTQGTDLDDNFDVSALTDGQTVTIDGTNIGVGDSIETGLAGIVEAALANDGAVQYNLSDDGTDTTITYELLADSSQTATVVLTGIQLDNTNVSVDGAGVITIDSLV